MHITSQLQSESRSNQHPVFQPTPRQELNMFSDQLHPNGSHGFVQASGPRQPCSRIVEYVPAFTTPTSFTHLSEASYGPHFRTDRHIALLIQTHLSFTSLAWILRNTIHII